MKIFFLFLCSLFLLISCQTAKKAEDAENTESSVAERIAQLLEQQKQDSLRYAFCDCLAKDSISREEQLKNIDDFISQKVDINTPCSFNEEVISNSLERIFVNMGVAVSNRILRTNFKKRDKETNIITKNYPILMLFNEDTSMIRELVNRGADLNTKTKDIISLPEFYVSQNDLENLKFVIDLGAETNQLYIISNEEKIIDFLIEKGATSKNIDKTTLLKGKNYKRLAKKYAIDLSSTTCEEFVQLSMIDKFKKINFERTKWLLENNIDASCIDGVFLEKVIDKNFDGRIYSSRTRKKSTQHSQSEWIELLGKHNVNWNQCASFGKTPLMIAIEKHDKQLIKTLLNQKADANFACRFAGQQKTAKNIIEKEIEYAKNNEARKKENNPNKYTQKDAKKHAVYMQTLNEIRKLLNQ